MTSRLGLLLTLLLSGCVVHEAGTEVELNLVLNPALTSDLGLELTLSEGVLQLHEAHLEPCPSEGLGALWEALAPVGTAYAHGGAPVDDAVPIEAMDLLFPTGPVLLHPVAGRYCSITLLFAPGPVDPTLRLRGQVSGPAGGQARAWALETPAWTRAELPLAEPLELSEAGPEATLTLTIDGPRWFAGLDLDRADPEIVGGLLLGRLSSVLSARLGEVVP